MSAATAKDADLPEGILDATVICTGADPAKKPPDREGRDLKGVHFAMEFLTANTRAVLDGNSDATPIHARGKDVVVIGGGDTGTDCVGTAMRHGCRSLVQIENSCPGRPSSLRPPTTPGPNGPRSTADGLRRREEAAARFGSDPRVYLTTVKKFLGDDAGAVKELTTVEIAWEKNEQGMFVPRGAAGNRKR